jgi:hypothetical protein
MSVFAVLIGAVIAYLLPSIIAAVRGHRNSNSICVVNIFLGWTLLGWVIALAWSFSDNVVSNESR